ncbi:DUF1433 domain-containing protein [Listeria sp. FSL L7-1509]|uniref:DUF1433 domain-containing protein n=2 Tax=Listeria immobilis TaxID=2713502 RepID=A0A7X0X9S5_9LIST|nr:MULTISPECIES: DUF1433 domain-containing protein [Listeria]MBC1490197.1 DUF1433 domain-containing protein [Listeria immobilis]MBC1507264.1 DUF1433 domain-containing protein [Listeria immobilis]MBC1511269.1 DUF1433 domain-containing protein [Listeria immobilis]MBC6298369.1 DUF1433 domain-containing protein [Listeria immobilis]MBC6304664.1 DUF1433 domain-containing protein [Listeria immobilis]
MKHQEKELMQEQKPRIEKFLKYNYNNIESITLTKTYTNPTGIVHIEGYLNNNEKLKIDAPLDGINGVEVVNTPTIFDDKYSKPQFKYEGKTVSGIEAEEKAKKKKEKESNTEESSLNTRSVQEIMSDLQSLEASILQNNRHPL